jgi:selenocysteine lyase/cysteine desulfurase
MQAIHLNTAGAGLASPETTNCMVAYLRREVQLGPYEAERLHANDIAQVRRHLATLLSAPDINGLALFDSGTRAWNSAIDALAPFPAGSRVWTSPYEYAGNLLSLQSMARRDGLALEVIPLCANGELDLDWIARQANSSVRLVSLVHVPSCCGRVLPVEAVGELLRRVAPHALYAVDACQSVGQLPVSVRDIGCDLLTAAGRKFLRGPRGTGFAVVGPRWMEAIGTHPLDLHAAEVDSLRLHHVTEPSARRLELSESHIAALLGLGAAAEQALSFDMQPVRSLFDRLHSGLGELPGVSLIASGGCHSGIVSFRHRGWPADAVVRHLREANINAWQISGHHTPLYLPPLGIDSAVRLSVHVTNSDSDVETLLSALSTLCTDRSTPLMEAAR